MTAMIRPPGRLTLQSGLLPEPQEFAARWAPDSRFAPAMDAIDRARKLAAWKDAVGRTLSSRAP
jgi:glycerol kinase